MDDSTVIRGSEAPVGASDRLRLARAARAAMLGVPGVVATDAGPTGLHVTTARGERLEGIICAATSDGGYDVSVRLIAGLVALLDLAQRVTVAIQRAAVRVGVRCSSVAVHVADIVPGEVR
jgi:hypothetical protein